VLRTAAARTRRTSTRVRCRAAGTGVAAKASHCYTDGCSVLWMACAKTVCPQEWVVNPSQTSPQQTINRASDRLRAPRIAAHYWPLSAQVTAGHLHTGEWRLKETRL
jgi:hypothetical protein